MHALNCGPLASYRSYIGRIHSHGQEPQDDFLYATRVQRIHPITMPPEESNEPLGDVIHVIFKVAIQNSGLG